jgi:hypothetical protein
LTLRLLPLLPPVLVPVPVLLALVLGRARVSGTWPSP